jgi:predicted nucleic acid-binding protein
MADRKYVIDANLFIQAFRDLEAEEALNRFLGAFTPFVYLSSVVAQELRAGVRSAPERRRLESSLLDVFGRNQRIITPSREAWDRSGDVLADLAARDGLEVGRVSKAFGNDILLALSCREQGMVLVTENQRDFARIRRVTPFEYSAPWPAK